MIILEHNSDIGHKLAAGRVLAYASRARGKKRTMENRLKRKLAEGAPPFCLGDLPVPRL
jgi:hypothetical protein